MLLKVHQNSSIVPKVMIRFMFSNQFLGLERPPVSHHSTGEPIVQNQGTTAISSTSKGLHLDCRTTSSRLAAVGAGSRNLSQQIHQERHRRLLDAREHRDGGHSNREQLWLAVTQVEPAKCNCVEQQLV